MDMYKFLCEHVSLVEKRLSPKRLKRSLSKNVNYSSYNKGMGGTTKTGETLNKIRTRTKRSQKHEDLIQKGLDKRKKDIKRLKIGGAAVGTVAVGGGIKKATSKNKNDQD